MKNERKKKKVTRKFKSGGLHEKHVVATWKLGNHLSIRLLHCILTHFGNTLYCGVIGLTKADINLNC